MDCRHVSEHERFLLFAKIKLWDHMIKTQAWVIFSKGQRNQCHLNNVFFHSSNVCLSVLLCFSIVDENVFRFHVSKWAALKTLNLLGHLIQGERPEGMNGYKELFASVMRIYNYRRVTSGLCFLRWLYIFMCSFQALQKAVTHPVKQTKGKPERM